MFNFLKAKNNQEGKDKDELEETNFALYLLFSKSFIMDKEKIISRISKINNEKVDVDPIYHLDGREALYCNIKIGSDNFKLVGLDAPIPEEVYDYTINCAYGDKDELDEMKKHKYHVVAFYEGESKEQDHIFNLYSKLAYGFLEHNLVGMANNYSWNALTPSLIKGMAEAEKVKELAATPAMMVWRNFLKIPHNNGVWFTTKGNNLYNIHEYAFFGTFEDTSEIYSIFEDIFYYEYSEEATLDVGHTMQVEEDVYLKFSQVYELEDALQGDGIGTLVIEKITIDEINKPS